MSKRKLPRNATLTDLTNWIFRSEKPLKPAKLITCSARIGQ